MIILFLGDVGSGKTLSAVKEIIQRNQYALTNFNLKKYKNYHRLEYQDIILTETDNKGRKRITGINWDFWNELRKKGEPFSIYLDEVSNILNARSSMSKNNQLMTRWLSQIRKITCDSDFCHLFLIAQKIRQVDVIGRDLVHFIVECQKIENTKTKETKIIQNWYCGIEHYENRAFQKPTKRMVFDGLPFYKYYDSLEMVEFSDDEVYI